MMKYKRKIWEVCADSEKHIYEFNVLISLKSAIFFLFNAKKKKLKKKKNTILGRSIFKISSHSYLPSSF